MTHIWYRQTSGNFPKTFKKVEGICISQFSFYDDYYADIICDDSKRVTLKGNNRTYHVDCEGYDLDGTLIISELPKFGMSDATNFRYQLNDEIDLVTAPWSDFFHCSQCYICKPFNFSSVKVSMEFSFHFFFNLKYSATRKNRLIFQFIRCLIKRQSKLIVMVISWTVNRCRSQVRQCHRKLWTRWYRKKNA